jgi:phosphoglycolate phosphatase
LLVYGNNFTFEPLNYELNINRMKYLKQINQRLRSYLAGLSFRTGVIVLLSCVVFYLLSFASLALPVSATLRGVLWATLFGCAKTAQYGGLMILGVDGVRRLKARFGR